MSFLQEVSVAMKNYLILLINIVKFLLKTIFVLAIIALLFPLWLMLTMTFTLMFIFYWAFDNKDEMENYYEWVSMPFLIAYWSIVKPVEDNSQIVDED